MAVPIAVGLPLATATSVASNLGSAASLGGAASVATDAIAAGISTGTLNLQLHAAAIAPEGAVLVALLACRLVDLAG